jgi:hypothetical protein
LAAVQKEAVIAWTVCASIHREYAKGKDPFFTTRQADFVKHETDARAALDALSEPEPKWRCVNGHDRCDQMYSGPDCPYCDRVLTR